MKLLQKNILLIFTIALLALAGVTIYSTQVLHANELQEQALTIAKLEQEVKTLSSAGDVHKAELKQQVVGQSIDRINPDTQAAEGLMRTAATWRNGDQYIQARIKVAKTYGLAENSQFMKTFLPGEAEGAFRVDKAGKTHFAYPDANSQLRKFNATLVNIDAKDRSLWTYFGVATIQVSSPNSGKIKRDIAVRYTVNGDHKIVDVTAYPSNQPPTVSN